MKQNSREFISESLPIFWIFFFLCRVTSNTTAIMLWACSASPNLEAEKWI